MRSGLHDVFDRLERVPVRRWARRLSGVVVALVVLDFAPGAAEAVLRMSNVDAERQDRIVWLLNALFNVDREKSIPALVSGVVLLAGGLLWVRATRRLSAAPDLDDGPTAAAPTNAQLARAPMFLGAALLFMAVDEVAAVHDLLELDLGVDWQLLYAPIVLALGVGALATLWLLSRHGAVGSATLLLAGSLCWLVSQTLEFLQWDGDVAVPGYAWYMRAEEALEVAGSGLLALAALALLQIAPAPSGEEFVR